VYGIPLASTDLYTGSSDGPACLSVSVRLPTWNTSDGPAESAVADVVPPEDVEVEYAAMKQVSGTPDVVMKLALETR
jgi:hypothetical protein